MNVMEVRSKPFVKEIEALLDQVQSQVARLVDQLERAKKKGDKERLDVLELQKVYLQTRLLVIKAQLEMIDD